MTFESNEPSHSDSWRCFTVINGVAPSLLSIAPVDFSPVCKLIQTPSWVREGAFEPSASERILESLKTSDVLLSFDYRASALGDPYIVDGVKTTRQNYVADLVLLFNVSAWLIGPYDVVSSGFFHFRVEDNYRVLRSAGDGQGIRFAEQTSSLIENVEQLRAIAKTWREITSVRRTSSVWVAIWMLHKALYERFWFIRLLMLWVALEALFGPLERQQLTHQLCERISLFIKGANADGQQLFVALKKSYGVRSKVVHGGGLGGDAEKGLVELTFIEGIVRDALNRILESKELIDIFSTKKRDTFLQELVFGGSRGDVSPN